MTLGTKNEGATPRVASQPTVGSLSAAAAWSAVLLRKDNIIKGTVVAHHVIMAVHAQRH